MRLALNRSTKLILGGTGVGLAAAAALELAYTLFTPGPDEALDPLMLGLSATILLKLAAIEGPISARKCWHFPDARRAPRHSVCDAAASC